MGSQFVDMNADGHLDYLTATFDGSPHVAYGSEEGFGEPEHVLDKHGERIIVTHYWDFDQEKHVVDHRSFGEGDSRTERCVSAWAWDWDADGDLDLLLGTYENGRLYRQMNEGTQTEPKFTGKNIEVMAGDAPFALPAKMTAPRMVDWDSDGDLDIIVGSFGDSYGQDAEGGGVYLARNTGEKGKPVFAALETLIEPSKKGHESAVRPDAGLYPDAVDWDGDGDLDLVVGGYSMWTPEGRELTAEEQAEVEDLTKKRDAFQKKQMELGQAYSKAYQDQEGKDPESEEVKKALADAMAVYRKAAGELQKEMKPTMDRLAELVPSPKREAFVWLYERK